MTYRHEFAANWRPLVAATIGMGLGLALNHYVMSLFAPQIIGEFGWSRAKYALVGATPFVSVLLFPFCGRLADALGPRIAASIGFVTLPIGYIALSFMTGNFALFLALNLFNSVLGVLTTTLVFARVVVERFDRARGIALSIVMSGAPLAGAIAVPFVAEIIDSGGWRNGFRALALITVVGGIISIGLLGNRRGDRPVERPKGRGITRKEAGLLFRSPVFLLALVAMFLVNLPQTLTALQLTLMLKDNGASGSTGTSIVALYAVGVAIGRILCGLGLDRIEAHKVALMALGLPALGLAAIASPFDMVWLLAGAVLLLGLAQGAEGDIGAYLVSRKLPITHYSFVIGMMTVALTLGAATGSLTLSYSLSATDSYNAFLTLSAVVTLIGAYLFFRTGRYSPAAGEVHDSVAEPDPDVVRGRFGDGKS